MGTPPFDLTNKTALITGSGQGLGFVIARGLGRAGARVIINGRDIQKLKAAAADLATLEIEVSTSPFDVTDANQVRTAIQDLHGQTGPLDILVNNAGIQIRAPLEDLSEDDWRTVIDTNLTAAFLVTKQVIRPMMKRGYGKIINICSLMSELGRKTTGPYTAAKGGLRMLTRAMCVEWASRNIQINGIGPGYFLTDMTRSLAEDETFDKWIRERTPAGRWGDPEELVGPAVFLASEASNFMNGQIVYVDGGLTAAI